MSYSEVSSLDLSTTASNSTVFSIINPMPLLKKVKSRIDLNKGLPSPPLPSFSLQDLNKNTSTVLISSTVLSSSSTKVVVTSKENLKEKNFFSNFGVASKLSKRLNQLPSPIFPPSSSISSTFNLSSSPSSNSSISPESYSRPSLSSSEYSSLYPNSSTPTSPNTPNSPNSYNSGGDIYSSLLRPSVQPISSSKSLTSNYYQQQTSFAPSRITVPTSRSPSSSNNGGRKEIDLADMRFDFYENEVEDRNEEEEQKAIEWKRMQEFEDRLMREDNNFDISMKKLYLL